MSLTPEVNKLEELQRKLYSKAKIEPTFRFYALCDKVYRWDVLTEALRLSKEKNGIIPMVARLVVGTGVLSVETTGSGYAHNNMQPSMALNYLIAMA